MPISIDRQSVWEALTRVKDFFEFICKTLPHSGGAYLLELIPRVGIVDIDFNWYA